MKTINETPFNLAIIAGIGMFLSTLDSGIINVAIPTFIKTFNTPIATVIWTITLYTLILSATILLFGRLADRIGRLKIYITGLLIFALSSLLCGAATNIWLLIIFRGLQGLSAAMMQATAIALITTRLDERDAIKAMGIFGILLGLGPMMGPVIGGLIISSIGWRWIFWINIPFCIFGFLGCKKLPKKTEELHQSPIHYTNLSLLATSLFSLLFTMSLIGHDSEQLNIAIIITIALFIVYLFMENKSAFPAIPLSLFKSLKFSAPMLSIFVFGGATAVTFILPPIYLEKLRFLAPWQVGLISLFAPMGLVIASQIAVRSTKKLGTLTSMATGFGIMVIALTILTQLTKSWGLQWLCVLLFCYGIGGGLFQVPCYVNLTKQFDKTQQSFISSLTRMIQNLGISTQVAAAAMLIALETQTPHHQLIDGIRHGWWLAASLCTLAWCSILMTYWKFRSDSFAK